MDVFASDDRLLAQSYWLRTILHPQIRSTELRQEINPLMRAAASGLNC